jgi:hypothetical protein
MMNVGQNCDLPMYGNIETPTVPRQVMDEDDVILMVGRQAANAANH